MPACRTAARARRRCDAPVVPELVAEQHCAPVDEIRDDDAAPLSFANRMRRQARSSRPGKGLRADGSPSRRFARKADLQRLARGVARDDRYSELVFDELTGSSRTSPIHHGREGGAAVSAASPATTSRKIGSSQEPVARTTSGPDALERLETAFERLFRRDEREWRTARPVRGFVVEGADHQQRAQAVLEGERSGKPSFQASRALQRARVRSTRCSRAPSVCRGGHLSGSPLDPLVRMTRPSASRTASERNAGPVAPEDRSSRSVGSCARSSAPRISASGSSSPVVPARDARRSGRSRALAGRVPPAVVRAT